LDPLGYYIYLYFVLLPILDAGAFYYTWRVRKITGPFRGWNLLLIFVVLFCLQGLATFFGAIFSIFNPSLIEAYVTKTGANSIISTSAYNLLVAAMLLVAMFEINRVFTRVNAESGKEASGQSN
jgi:hypothetical protein